MKDKDILAEALECFQAGIDADRENRDRDREDRLFYKGAQWPDEVKRERATRPMLTINRQPQFVKQLAGEIRQNSPAIKVLPVDGKTDPALAEVVAAIIRHVESLSDAHRIYAKTGEQAAIGGQGWWRVTADYADDDSLEQELKVERIWNPLAVVCDPDAREVTRSDMSWCFVTELVSRKAFEKKYPKAKTVSFESTDGANTQGWVEGDYIRVAEYWRKRKVGERRVVFLNDGQSYDADAIDYASIKAGRVPGFEIIGERTVPVFGITQYTMTGVEILDAREWPGRYIPIVRVAGEEIEVGEEVYRHGLIHFTKDAQRSYNYARSAMIEHVALQPKAPFIATAKQIQNYKRLWERANTDNLPALIYDADPQAPAPQRAQPPTLPAAFYQEAQIADMDMKATTGIYDASLGSRSNETSGVAIRARDQQGETATYVYIDNLEAAIRWTGYILLDLIPTYYSDERIIRILGEDGAVEKFAEINKMMPDGRVWNDVTRGRYDIQVSTGPAYATKRIEAMESMMQFVQAVPPAAALIADLVAKNADWPGAEKIAERLRRALPPGIDDEADQQRAPDPAQQAQMQMQQKAVELQLAEAEAKIVKLRAEMLKMSADVHKTEAETEKVTAETMQILQAPYADAATRFSDGGDGRTAGPQAG